MVVPEHLGIAIDVVDTGHLLCRLGPGYAIIMLYCSVLLALEKGKVCQKLIKYSAVAIVGCDDHLIVHGCGRFTENRQALRRLYCSSCIQHWPRNLCRVYK
jgi:hypothetical protein